MIRFEKPRLLPIMRTKNIYILSLLLSGMLLPACNTKNNAEADVSGLYIKLLGGSKDDVVYDAYLNPQGEVIGVGYTKTFVTPPNTQGAFVFKIDALGNKVWQNTLEGIEANCVTPTLGGGYTLLGSANLPFPFEKTVGFWKINEEGKLLLKDTLTFDNITVEGTTIRTLPTGDYIVLGKAIERIPPAMTTTTKNYLARLNNSGNKKFDKFYFTESYTDNIPYGMAMPNASEAIIAGKADSYARLISINDELGVRWDYIFQSNIASSTSLFRDIQVLPSGLLICAGNTITSQKRIPFLVQTNLQGELIWKKNIDISASVDINAIAYTQDGGYILTGAMDITTDDKIQTDVWVGKVNSNGDLEWQKNLGGRRDDVGKDVQTTQEGNFVILADIGFENNKMIGIIRIDKNGNLVK